MTGKRIFNNTINAFLLNEINKTGCICSKNPVNYRYGNINMITYHIIYLVVITISIYCAYTLGRKRLKSSLASQYMKTLLEDKRGLFCIFNEIERKEYISFELMTLVSMLQMHSIRDLINIFEDSQFLTQCINNLNEKDFNRDLKVQNQFIYLRCHGQSITIQGCNIGFILIFCDISDIMKSRLDMQHLFNEKAYRLELYTKALQELGVYLCIHDNNTCVTPNAKDAISERLERQMKSSNDNMSLCDINAYSTTQQFIINTSSHHNKAFGYAIKCTYNQLNNYKMYNLLYSPISVCDANHNIIFCNINMHKLIHDIASPIKLIDIIEHITSKHHAERIDNKLRHATNLSNEDLLVPPISTQQHTILISRYHNNHIIMICIPVSK